MQEAVPVGTGAMAAVLGAELGVIEEICKQASNGQVCSPANINSPNQVVIAGDSAAVDRATELLQGVAKKVVQLIVSAPFHCGLMMPAQERLSVDLHSLNFCDPEIPIVTNVGATSAGTSSEVRDALVAQVAAPVRWLESMQFLLRTGVNTVVEIGPGKVLCGLMRQISREVQSLNVEDMASLAHARSSLARFEQ
jgi:[acyl-carrier-protein] S-malonyltransferase